MTVRSSLARLVRSGCFAVFGGLLIPTLAASSAGQVSERGSQPEMIPRDLVLALITFGPGVGNADLRVGTVPEDTPPELLPPGAQVLGSMSQFETVVIVLGVPEAPDSAISAMESRLLAGGWTRPRARTPSPMPRGFVGGDFLGGGMGGMPSYVCRGEQAVNLTAMYRSSGGSLLKLNYNRSGRYPMCRDEATMRSPYDDAPIPTLRAPAGAMLAGGSGMSSSGSGGVTMHARLSTRLTPAEIVAHYDTQMKADGWTPAGDGSVEFLAARRYRKKDERNRDWYGTLYAIKASEGVAHDVALHLTRR